MDRYAQLPLTLSQFIERLQAGHTFRLARSEDGFSYALSMDEKGGVILQQGSQNQPFRQPEKAIMTLLNCLGEWNAKKDEEAIKAAEEYMLRIYTDTPRDTVEECWGYGPEELAKIQYNGDGYLVCGVGSSRILDRDHEADGEDEWIIEVVPDIGVPITPEQYRVYQGLDGEWIVESVA